MTKPKRERSPCVECRPDRAEIDRDRKEKERQSVEQYKDACDNEERNDE